MTSSPHSPAGRGLPASSTISAMMYGHADKGIRSFFFQQRFVFPEAQERSGLQGSGAESGDRLRDQLAQAVGAGEGKTDQGHAFREDQLAQPGHVETYRVLKIVLRIEDALGRAGGAGGRIGKDALDLRLRAKQQRGSVPGEIFLGGEGKIRQARQGCDPLRQIAVKAAALLLARQKAIQLFQLDRLDRFPVNTLQSLLLRDQRIQAGDGQLLHSSPLSCRISMHFSKVAAMICGQYSTRLAGLPFVMSRQSTPP